MTEVLKVLKHNVTNASLCEITSCSLSTWLLNPQGKYPLRYLYYLSTPHCLPPSWVKIGSNVSSTQHSVCLSINWRWGYTGRLRQGHKESSNCHANEVLDFILCFKPGNICYHLKICVATALRINSFLCLYSNPEAHNLTLHRFWFPYLFIGREGSVWKQGSW